MYPCISATKLREFQYKILHSTLLTAHCLENDGCTCCHNLTETLLHLFLECEVSRGLWNDITEYLAQLCNLRIETSHVNITSGIVGTEDSHNLLNLMNIAIKCNIYTCRCNNKHLTVPSTIGKK